MAALSTLGPALRLIVGVNGAPLGPAQPRRPRRIRAKPRPQTVPWFCRPPSPIGRVAPSPPPTPCAARRTDPPRFLPQRRPRARRRSSLPRRPLSPLSSVLATRQWPFVAPATDRPPWRRPARQFAPSSPPPAIPAGLSP